MNQLVEAIEGVSYRRSLSSRAGSPAALLHRVVTGWWQSGNVPWLRDMGIQARFTVLIAVVAVAGLAVGSVYGIGEHRLDLGRKVQAEYLRLWELSSTIRTDALAMQTAANGLTAERQHAFIDEFASHYQQVSGALAAIKSSPVTTDHGDEIAGLDQASAEVAAQFKTVADVTVALGLTAGDGLRGRLSTSVKAIDDELKMWPNTDDLKARMSRMREAEKNFMLYQDEAYLGKFRGQALQFDIGIDSAALPNSTKDSFRAMATQYSADMATYGSASLDQQAQIAKLRTMFAALQPRIQAFAAMANDGMTAASHRQADTRASVGFLISLVGFLALLTVLLFGLVAGRSIARPVLMMKSAMSRLAGGDLAVEIPGVHRADEVGLMAQAVQVFRDNAVAMEELRVRQEAEQAAKELRARKLEALIAAFDSDVSSVIHIVATSANGAESTARDMDSFAGQTVEQMHSVDHSSGAATANVQAMAAAAEQLAYSIGEISARVNEASQVAVRTADAATRTDTVVHSLVEASQRIETVVTFIQTIAAQTRMLALNATIEAARAGEHGHGFSIVAEEVKQLAAKTTQATDEIAQQIAAVQAAGREAAVAIHEIAASVRTVDEISGSIAAAVEQQGAATQEIARSAQDAAKSTTLVAETITWVAQEAAQMQTAATAMLGASVQMSGQSEVLRVIVDNFLMGVHDGEPTLKWGDNWLTGHPVIDADHKMLVQYVNELSAAMMQSKGRNVISATLDKLAQYTVDHFAREEAIWTENNLPGLADHKGSHADLTATVLGFIAAYKAGKQTLTMEVMAFLRDWLINHVFKTDKVDAAFIAGKARTQP
jgi:methyl-accepting chemotaxis protein